VVSSLRTYPRFGEALALLAESDIARRREFRPAGFATTTGIASGSTFVGSRHVQRHNPRRRNRMAKKKAAKKAVKKAATRSKKKPAKKGGRPRNPPLTGTIGPR
jgi:hypothetical protein